MHKRVAISLNCISEMLTDSDDEILLVDCNTPDDMPTLCESIQDTLSDRTKKLLKIFRIRPEIYERHKRGSPLKVLEGLCRNVAIRRSNPKNRWILSTNPDIVLVPKRYSDTLSEVVKHLPDGFYELPRFEIPEGIWEMFDRRDPKSIIEFLVQWGYSLRFNIAIFSDYVSLYNAPGDFQLMLRRQIFQIQGFNEKMIYGWHLDSNLCRRMHLLNGRVRSLISHFFSYHLGHTKQATLSHLGDIKEDSLEEYYYFVKTPYLPEQAEDWGIPQENIEEIRLNEKQIKRLFLLLKDRIPSYDRMMVDHFTFNHGLIIDKYQILPYISDQILFIPSEYNIGYLGVNFGVLKEIARFRIDAGHRGEFLYCKELVKDMSVAYEDLPNNCLGVNIDELLERSSIFIVDCSMNHFPIKKDEKGICFPKPSLKLIRYARDLFDLFLTVASYEAKRINRGKFLPRKFIIIGSQNTLFDRPMSNIIDIVHTPYSTRIRHGYIKKDAESQEILFPQYHTLIFGLGYIQKLLSVKFKRMIKISEVLYLENKIKQLEKRLLQKMKEGEDIDIEKEILSLNPNEMDLIYIKICAFFNMLNMDSRIINKERDKKDFFKHIRGVAKSLSKDLKSKGYHDSESGINLA